MKNLWTNINKLCFKKTPSKGVKTYYALLSVIMMLMCTISVQISATGATTAIGEIADTVKNAFIEIYSVIMSIVTIIAIVLVAICLVIRMLHKNPRACEEATQWIKRIVISWLLLMLLSLFVQYGNDIVVNSGANTQNPWEPAPPATP